MTRVKRTILMTCGVILMGAGAALAAYNLYEDASATTAAEETLAEFAAQRDARMTATEPTLPPGLTGEVPEEETLDPERAMPTIMIDGVPYIGTIQIPALGLELPVAADWDYTRMRTSPCRYAGSPYNDTLVICAHNYSTHFRNIKDLQPGDPVTFIDADGEAFSYTVAQVETLPPTAVNEMVTSSWALSLFTCNYAGNARVTVRAVPAEETETQ